MEFAWYDAVGTAGVVCVLAAYFLLQVKRLDADTLAYSVINLAGAALIAVSLVFAFNFSAFLIQVCWIAISLIGIVRALRGGESRS